MNRLLIALLTIVSLATLGCDPKRPVADVGETTAQVESSGVGLGESFVTGRDTNDITINGFKVVYPKSLEDKQISMIRDVMKIEFKEFSFEIRDGEILVEDLNYGPASPGDEILIGLEGDIAVNGKRVEPRSDD